MLRACLIHAGRHSCSANSLSQLICFLLGFYSHHPSKGAFLFKVGQICVVPTFVATFSPPVLTLIPSYLPWMILSLLLASAPTQVYGSLHSPSCLRYWAWLSQPSGRSPFEDVVIFARSWLPRELYYRQEHKSLFKHLHHTVKVVGPGRTSWSPMINQFVLFSEEWPPHSS